MVRLVVLLLLFASPNVFGKAEDSGGLVWKVEVKNSDTGKGSTYEFRKASTELIHLEESSVASKGDLFGCMFGLNSPTKAVVSCTILMVKSGKADGAFNVSIGKTCIATNADFSKVVSSNALPEVARRALPVYRDMANAPAQLFVKPSPQGPQYVIELHCPREYLQ